MGGGAWSMVSRSSPFRAATDGGLPLPLGKWGLTSSADHSCTVSKKIGRVVVALLVALRVLVDGGYVSGLGRELSRTSIRREKKFSDRREEFRQGHALSGNDMTTWSKYHLSRIVGSLLGPL